MHPSLIRTIRVKQTFVFIGKSRDNVAGFSTKVNYTRQHLNVHSAVPDRGILDNRTSVHMVSHVSLEYQRAVQRPVRTALDIPQQAFLCLTRFMHLCFCLYYSFSCQFELYIFWLLLYQMLVKLSPICFSGTFIQNMFPIIWVLQTLHQHYNFTYTLSPSINKHQLIWWTINANPWWWKCHPLAFYSLRWPT